jgi:hypothetical protein
MPSALNWLAIYQIKLKRASFFPRLIEYKKDFTSYTLEYVPSKNLAEIILNNQITIDEGKNILKRLLSILDAMHSYTSSTSSSPVHLYTFYLKNAGKNS